MDGERTKHGGIRRSTRDSSDAQSGSRIKSASVPRKHLPGPFIFKWREKLGLPSCPYVIRWRFETPWFSVRLHHWLASDDDRAFHDHPWSFTTFVLKGEYVDDSPAGPELLKAPCVRRRPAEHRHTVYPGFDGCWTVIVTGPKVRTWGFWTLTALGKEKFVKANKWFASRGHHPCD